MKRAPISPAVAVVFHRLGPYHCARLEAAARVGRIAAVELSAETSEYAWDKVAGQGAFERRTLFESGDSRRASLTTLRQRVAETLGEFSPDAVVIPGWSDKGSLACLDWSLKHRVPVVVMSESTSWDEARAGWKEWIKKRVVGMCRSALAGGTPHADYLASLGMARDRIFLGYDAVDNDYFAKRAEEVRGQRSEVGGQRSEVRNQKSEIRNRLGLPERYFLTSARFIEKKNLPRLLQAYARYRELASKAESGKRKAEIWDLVLLGDGPLRPDLCSLISDLCLQNSVHLPGFKQYPDLPAYYALAGAFIHASTVEQWGLVVNEAMASGLPVLVSNRCGCATDLVQEGINGFTFDPGNTEQLAQLMLKISAFNFPLSAFGDASRQIISNWGPARFDFGLKAAVDKALEVGPTKPTVFQSVLVKGLLYS